MVLNARTVTLVFALCNLSLAEVPQYFSSFYHQSYQSRKCGENVLNFFRGLSQSGNDISALTMVTIENKGFSVFGMVNAEKARAAPGSRKNTEERNWYHHIFAIDAVGTVYDFDYLSEPSPRPFSFYVEDMFLNELECTQPISGEFCAGRAEKLDSYELSFYRAKEILSGSESPYWKGSLKEALRKFSGRLKSSKY
jgi:hypothetical protein